MRMIVSLFLVLCLAFTSTTTYAADSYMKATGLISSIKLNGEPAQLDGLTIQGSNYFKLRDLAAAFSGTSSQFDVSWSSEHNAVEIHTGKPYSVAKDDDDPFFRSNMNYMVKPTDSTLFVDGKAVPIQAYNKEGSNYFKLRDLGKLIPFEVSFNGVENEILLFSNLADNSYRVTTAFAAPDNTVSSRYPRWKETIKSYLTHNDDGTVSVIEEKENKVTIETYDSQYRLVAQKRFDNELPLFGGFYSDAKSYYVAYGQENHEENDNKEVIRIVRYDKSFNRISSVSVKGGESFTTVPFDAAAGRMTENGDTLVFHTSRERYTTEDGLNHQSQLTIIVDTSKMKVINDLGRFQSNHVSHSFDQYVLFDGSDLVLLDHGDAYPRSIVLHKGDGTTYEETDLFKIPGAIGANTTGVSIGGFEMSASNYITTMNTIDHSKVIEYTSYEMKGLPVDRRDIILTLLPRSNMQASAVKTVKVASYTTSELFASIPKLVKINDDKLIVMWQEFTKEGKPSGLKYVYIDGNGNVLGAIQSLDHFLLSDSQPIVINNQVVWYVNVDGIRAFYVIPTVAK
ncbi:hypothetical protein [Paenibacillus sp. YAF4_2]|uniref:hypothetical protein n=1 Tax=Paenibacillus sp. YAF4_2 TaxID=3233085 RepID=UPI003F9A6735